MLVQPKKRSGGHEVKLVRFSNLGPVHDPVRRFEIFLYIMIHLLGTSPRFWYITALRHPIVLRHTIALQQMIILRSIVLGTST